MDNIVLENFTSLSDDDLLQILSWRNRDDIRLQMTNSNIISKEEHLQFCHNLKNRKDCLYFRVSFNNLPCGVFSLQHIDYSKKSVEPGAYYISGPKFLPYWVCQVVVDIYVKLGISSIVYFVKKTNEKAILFNIFKNKAKVVSEDDDFVYFSQSLEYILNETNNDTSKFNYSIIW